MSISRSRSSRPGLFLRKGVLKIYSKFTGEHPCRSAISIKLQSNFIEITLRHECSPVNLLHIFRTAFPGNTSGWLLLYIIVAVGQGSPSGTVSHPIYHPLVYKLLLLIHEVHLKRFYEKQHVLHIWHKDNVVDSLIH